MAPDAGGSGLEERRIIFVLSSLDMGGAERQALLLARRLRERHGADARIWGFGEPGLVARACDEQGLAWRKVDLDLWSSGVSSAAKLLRLLKLARLLREARPDVLFTYTINPNVDVGLIWRLTGARLCVWNQRDLGIMRRGATAEHAAIKLVPLFVANSSGAAEFLIGALGAPEGRVEVVHNGVDLGPAESDRGQWRERLGLGPDDFAACMLGNVQKYKDHETLMRAWRIVADELDSQKIRAVLLLAGYLGNRGQQVKALAFDLGLCGSVRLLGAVQDVPGLLSAVDLGVLSSRSESLPNAALECMAAGLAVAATDNRGVREALGEHADSLTAPIGDGDALSRKIVELALDPGRRAAIGDALRQRAASEFSPERMAEQMAEILSEGLRSAGA